MGSEGRLTEAVDMIPDESCLDQLFEAIVGKVNPLRVILFGSVARGEEAIGKIQETVFSVITSSLQRSLRMDGDLPG